MIRKRLSWQLALAMLAVSLIPLLGAGFLTLGLLERSIVEQVRSGQEQQARAAAALVRDYLADATHKLQSIAVMIDRTKDAEEQVRTLNGLIEPKGIFLEVGSWTVGSQPEVNVQAQQAAFNAYQGQSQGSPNRAYNSKVRQYVQTLRNEDPIVVEPLRDNPFTAEIPETAGGFPSLPMSVPASGRNILAASLDLRPLSQMLASLAGPGSRVISLLDGVGGVVASSSAAPVVDAVERRQTVGHGRWEIAVREPREEAMASLRAARFQAMLWLGLAFIMAVGLAGVVAARVLRPVRALAAAADRLGRGEFSARTGISREDELGQLAGAFDRMAAAVEELDCLKDDFVSHVSHELRTPLTSAKATLVNVLDGVAGKDALSRVRQDLDRLILMVNELLDAARIEAGIKLARQTADLGVVARAAVDTLRPIARHPIEVTGTGDTIEIDSARVQQIVVNLVDNALKYARSRVDVSIAGREVRVADDGPGVPPDARERIFEKFGRAEAGAKPPGVGLGLSIARKLAELHGGSLVCEGNVFVLRL